MTHAHARTDPPYGHRWVEPCRDPLCSDLSVMIGAEVTASGVPVAYRGRPYVDVTGAPMVEWCNDCGHSTPARAGAYCPYGSDRCSDCSMQRESLGHTRLDCPAHGAYLPDPEPRS